MGLLNWITQRREKAGLYPYSEEWDRALNEALDKYPISEIGTHTCRVGPYLVWVSNFSYAYGNLYSPKIETLPKQSTRRRLKKAMEAAAINHAQDTWAAPAKAQRQERSKP